MLVDRLVTYLEMTSPDQLRPAAEVENLALLPVDNLEPEVRETLHRVGTPHGWSEVGWSAQRWSAEMAKPALYHWLVTVDGKTAGLLGLQSQPGGSVEITAFGLVPERVGQGYGGPALTQAIRLAWSRPPVDDEPVRRVFLHTSSLDHPNALGNYRRRGLRAYRTEHRQEDVPDPMPAGANRLER